MYEDILFLQIWLFLNDHIFWSGQHIFSIFLYIWKHVFKKKFICGKILYKRFCCILLVFLWQSNKMPGVNMEMDGDLFFFWTYSITSVWQVPPECRMLHAMAKWESSAIISIIWSGQNTAKYFFFPQALNMVALKKGQLFLDCLPPYLPLSL